MYVMYAMFHITQKLGACSNNLAYPNMYILCQSNFVNIYTYTNDHLPVTLRNMFVMNTDIHEYNTRHRLDPHIITRNSSAMSKTCIHTGTNIIYG